MAAQSAQMFCRYCKAHDHFLNDKPGPEGKTVCPKLLATVCGACGEKGHTERRCKAPDAQKTCRYCRETGHSLYDTNGKKVCPVLIEKGRREQERHNEHKAMRKVGGCCGKKTVFDVMSFPDLSGNQLRSAKKAAKKAAEKPAEKAAEKPAEKPVDYAKAVVRKHSDIEEIRQLQVKIHELEKQVAEIVALKAENEQLTKENESLKAKKGTSLKARFQAMHAKPAAAAAAMPAVQDPKEIFGVDELDEENVNGWGEKAGY